MPNRRCVNPAPILKHQDSSDGCGSSGSDTNSDPSEAPLPFATCGAASFHSTRVRFPPGPQLASAGLTYPPCAYDRAPIVVAPNTCALPRRGTRCYPCPPVAYDSDSDSDDAHRGRDPARDALAAASIAVPPRMAPGSALAFLPHAPAGVSCAEKKKRRSQTPAPPRRRRALPTPCSFEDEDTSGCLGGF